MGLYKKKCTEKSFFFELNGLLQASELIGGSKMIDKFDFPFVFIEQNLGRPDIAYFFVDTIKVPCAIDDLIDEIGKFLFR